MIRSHAKVDSEEVLALVQGKLSPRRAEALRALIREDDEARALYDRLAGADEAIDPSSAVRRIEARVFDKRSFERKPRAAAFLPWLGGVAVASALAVAVMPPGVGGGEYASRGQPTLDGDHVLQVLRAEVNEAGEVSIEQATTVHPGDPLRFALASVQRRAEVSLLAVDGETRTVLRTKAPVTRGSNLKRLDLAYRVPDAAGPQLRIIAVFSHGAGTIEFETLNLDPRDAEDLSVRAVDLAVEARRP